MQKAQFSVTKDNNLFFYTSLFNFTSIKIMNSYEAYVFQSCKLKNRFVIN